MAHILVTGGNGFIGSHIVDALAHSGQHHVTVLDIYPRLYDPIPSGVTFVQGNLSDPSLIRRTLEDNAIQFVYHIAWTTIHETSLKDPVADIETNLVMSVRLLEACRDARVKRVVYISSGGTVYGLPHTLPIREDHPTNPINAYGVTKLAVEKYLQMYFHLYGLEYVILRPSVAYGPHQNPYRRQGVIAAFIYCALRGQPVTIWGDGEVVRDYVYVEDLTHAFLTALDLPFTSDGIFNLAGMQACSLNQLIRMIEEALGVKIEARYEPARKFDVPQLRLDISAAAEKMGWHPVTRLSDGLQQTATWIQTWNL
jgi:UDP-glucose 4-epimerase